MEERKEDIVIKKQFFCHWKVLAWAAILLPLSFFGGLYFNYLFPGSSANMEEVRDANDGYKFINPLLDVGPGKQLSDRRATETKKKIKEFIDRKNNAADARVEASVYYRDLNNGPWFGINEKETYIPASLLKLPLLIAYLKIAEKDPSIFEKELSCDVDVCVNDYQVAFSPEKSLVFGEKYKVFDLLERMIIDSDNGAKNLLFLNIDEALVAQVFIDLGVTVPAPEKTSDFLSTKEYASFFRILYNASYLNREMSDFALFLLSRSNFDIGLDAGVPEGVTVANKFGERHIIAMEPVFQLHDCGIIYHSKTPYLLCIMTRGGSSFEELSGYISGISKIVYESVDE
jgi:beta-lactamase class A